MNILETPWINIKDMPMHIGRSSLFGNDIKGYDQRQSLTHSVLTELFHKCWEFCDQGQCSDIALFPVASIV